MDIMSQMQREAGEAAAAAATFAARNRDAFARLAAQLSQRRLTSVVTCARGSSDHAATYAKYLIETRLGLPTASAALSVASIFGHELRPDHDRLCLAISQSGRSPDILQAARAYQDAGAFLIAFVNDEDSPLFALADAAIPLCAGPECSVAATKSFILSLTAIATLAAVLGDDRDLADALGDLPQDLARAWELDWSAALDAMGEGRSLFTVSRGYGFGIAQEAALKLKEVCGLHAEAFSSAEVRHGPMAIVSEGFPVLGFATSDRAGDDVRAVMREFGARGARTELADASGGGSLPAIAAHPAIEPILMIQSFYRFAERLARARGFDPDAPPYLRKVTETL